MFTELNCTNERYMKDLHDVAVCGTTELYSRLMVVCYPWSERNKYTEPKPAA